MKPLSFEEKMKLNKQFFGGVTDDASEKEKESYLSGFRSIGGSIFKDIPSDIRETGQGIFEAGRSAVGRVREAQERSPDQRAISTAFQAVGQAAGGAADILGETVIGAGKLFLPQDTEEKIKSGVTDVMTGIIESEFGTRAAEDWSKFSESNPEAAENIKAGLRLGEVGAEVTGLGVAGTGAQAAGRGAQAARRGAATTIDQVTKRAAELTPVQISPGKFQVPGKGTIKAVADVFEDVKPKAAALRDQQFVTTFKLSPTTDVAAIEKSAGIKSIGEWASVNDLIKDTPEETITAMAKFKQQNYDVVRDALNLVDRKYTKSEIPALDALTDNILADLQDAKSVELIRMRDQMQAIKKADNVDLAQVQFVKEVSDDIESVHKRGGDVRPGVKPKDIANQQGSLRRFIEDEVNELYPDINVRELNKNVQISKGFMDAAVKRSGKFDTQSLLDIGDYATFGAGEVALPGAGIAALLTKKVLQSGPIKLRVARWMGNRVKKGDLTKTEIKEIRELIQKELGRDIELKDFDL